MTLMMARYDHSKKAYTEEAFCFDPMPLIQGRELDADIGIYLACYARAGVLPTGPSLLFMGEPARGLFFDEARRVTPGARSWAKSGDVIQP